MPKKRIFNKLSLSYREIEDKRMQTDLSTILSNCPNAKYIIFESDKSTKVLDYSLAIKIK